MAEKHRPIRFGILGCAGIARRISQAIALSPKATISAIGSRSIEKAKSYAVANNFPPNVKVYGSYEALLDDPDVDAVYVPLPTSLHLRWAVLVAQKKKHLLLEKPVALNVAELDAILDACESNGVQYMDGTMWMHHPRTAKMKEFLSQMGQLESMHSYFTYAADPDFLKNDIRVKPELDALGVLGDAGWYCIRAILWATNFELPNRVVASQGPVFNESGVLLSCGSSLYWEDGKVATFHCSFLSNLTADFTAVGRNGNLHVHDFIIPFKENQASFTVLMNTTFEEIVKGTYAPPSTHTIMTDLPQDALMVTEFSRLVGEIKRGRVSPEKHWPAISRKTQLVIDAVMESIERGFESVDIGN